MSRGRFIPAARFAVLTRFYDLGCAALGLGSRFRGFEVQALGAISARTILEVGCGTGQLLRALVVRYPAAAVLGIDPDPATLRVARKKLAGVASAAKVIQGRAERLPCRDGSVDLLVSSLMLHHLDTPTKAAALTEWRRVLAPAGHLFLVDLGPPRSWVMKTLSWPLRFHVLEEQADNFRGRVPSMLHEAGFEFEEVARYGSLVYAFRARAAECGRRASVE
jgi:ubiquinone/menaquinone biosynthesis C-methylase UbiE